MSKSGSTKAIRIVAGNKFATFRQLIEVGPDEPLGKTHCRCGELRGEILTIRFKKSGNYGTAQRMAEDGSTVPRRGYRYLLIDDPAANYSHHFQPLILKTSTFFSCRRKLNVSLAASEARAAAD
jgi:hypothetical protein